MNGHPCSGTDDDGTPCAGVSHRRNGYCPVCLGRRSGLAKQRARIRRARTAPPDLRSVAGCQAELERLLANLDNANQAESGRIKVAVAVVQAAHAIIASDVKAQTEALEQLLRDNPRLAEHMRAVQ